MVQHGDGGHRVKAVMRKRMRHDVAFNERDPRFRSGRSSGLRESVAVRINRDDFRAMLGKLSREHSLAASGVERAGSRAGNRAQHDLVIVNVAVPWAARHWFGYYRVPRSRL